MKRRKGFTLIEILVTVSTLALLITPFFYLLFNSLELSLAANRLSTAVFVGQSGFEKIVGKEFSEFGFAGNRMPEVKDVNCSIHNGVHQTVGMWCDVQYTDGNTWVTTPSEAYSWKVVTAVEWGIEVSQPNTIGSWMPYETVFLGNLAEVTVEIFFYREGAEEVKVHELKGVVNMALGGF